MAQDIKLYDASGRPIAIKSKPEPSQTKKRKIGAGSKSLAGCTIIGLLIVFWPRPVVTPSAAPFDPQNALSIAFDMNNRSFLLPLSDVTAALGVGQIGAGGTKPNPDFIPNFQSRIEKEEWSHHYLPMDAGFTVNGTSFFVGSVIHADIAIIVDYKLPLLPFKFEKVFRFTTYRETDGKSRWRSWPLGEHTPAI